MKLGAKLSSADHMQLYSFFFFPLYGFLVVFSSSMISRPSQGGKCHVLQIRVGLQRTYLFHFVHSFISFIYNLSFQSKQLLSICSYNYNCLDCYLFDRFSGINTHVKGLSNQSSLNLYSVNGCFSPHRIFINSEVMLSIVRFSLLSQVLWQ